MTIVRREGEEFWWEGGALWSECLARGAELLNTALHKSMSMNCCEKHKLDLLNEVNYINFDCDYE